MKTWPTLMNSKGALLPGPPSECPERILEVEVNRKSGVKTSDTHGGGNSRRPQASTNSLISLSAVQLSPYLSLKPLPFEIPGLSSDRSFSGREWLFQEVDNRLSSDDPLVNRGVVIVGSMGFGKTAVIARLAALSCHGDRMWPTSSALQTAPKCKRGRTPSCNRSHPNVQNRICAGIPETFGVRENLRCRHLKTNIVAKRPPPPRCDALFRPQRQPPIPDS